MADAKAYARWNAGQLLGVEQQQIAWLITTRSHVQFMPPGLILFTENTIFPANNFFAGTAVFGAALAVAGAWVVFGAPAWRALTAACRQRVTRRLRPLNTGRSKSGLGQSTE